MCVPDNPIAYLIYCISGAPTTPKFVINPRQSGSTTRIDCNGQYDGKHLILSVNVLFLLRVYEYDS